MNDVFSAKVAIPNFAKGIAIFCYLVIFTVIKINNIFTFDAIVY